MKFSELIVRGILLLSVTLGSLALLGGVSTSQKIAAALVLAVGIVATLDTRVYWPRATAWGAGLLIGFVGLTAIALIRYHLDPLQPVGNVYLLEAVTLILLVTFLFAALAACRDETAGPRLACAVFAPVVFVLANVGLYALGWDFTGAVDEETVNGQSTMLGYAGIAFDRTSLPLAVGLNGGGSLGAVSMVVGGVFARLGFTRNLRLAGWAGVLGGLAVVLMVDSRGPLLFALLTLVALALLPRWSRRGLAWVPFLLPLAPVAITWALAQLGSAASSVSRDGTDALTATGRTRVWDAAFDYLGQFRVEDLYGYGTFGQVKTGLSLEYMNIFTADNRRFASLHNAILQNVLDMGYIGAAAFIGLLAVAIITAARRYEVTGQPEALAALGMVIVIGLIGATEPIPSVFAPAALSSFVVASTVGIRTTGVTATAREYARRRVAWRAAVPVVAVGVWMALVVGTVSLMQF